jgi:hypothetical protein
MSDVPKTGSSLNEILSIEGTIKKARKGEMWCMNTFNK